MKRLLTLLAAGALLLTGCAPREKPAAFGPQDSQRLVVYTSHKPDVYQPIVEAFEARTGVWVQVVAGGTHEMLEQLAFESQLPACDVMFGGGVESLAAYGDYFEAVPWQETWRIAPEYESQGSPWVPFSALPLVLIYNPRLLGPQERPAAWRSLLDEKFRGRIAFADPLVSGSSYTALATLLQALPQPREDTLAAFYENLGGGLIADSGQVVDAVAQGGCLIGVTLEETALKALAAGKNVAMVYPREGTSAVPDGAAKVKNCPHPQNARLFIDFILSQPVQARLASQLFRRPVRGDVPSGREPLALIPYDVGWASREKGRLLAQWQALWEAAP